MDPTESIIVETLIKFGLSPFQRREYIPQKISFFDSLPLFLEKKVMYGHSVSWYKKVR